MILIIIRFISLFPTKLSTIFPISKNFFVKSHLLFKILFIKLGGTSEKKIEQALFFTLGLHYFG